MSSLAGERDPDLELVTNLGWLALQMEVMFRQGKYAKALAFAGDNKSKVPKEYLDKAAGYAAEAVWNVFRSGQREEATQRMMALSREYPGIRRFQEAKDRMVMALLDDTADIPLPKPLPDQQQAQRGGGFVAPESEVLKIRAVKRTLKPRDRAYALVVGIRKYRDLNGPRFADNDARQVQRLLTRMAGFRNDPAHVRLRLDSDATIGTLYGDLHWLLRKARLNPDAKIFFYFSGHGSPRCWGPTERPSGTGSWSPTRPPSTT